MKKWNNRLAGFQKLFDDKVVHEKDFWFQAML